MVSTGSYSCGNLYYLYKDVIFMSTVKNGTSIYDIKEFMTNQVAPKYFSKIADMNQMNVGLFGYITEILANTSITTNTFIILKPLRKL